MDSRKARIAALAAAIAIPAEGLRQFAYYDPPGILTVCYGHTGDVQKGRKYSLDECKALLDKDMAHAVAVVEKFAPGLPEKTTAGLADGVFNIGEKLIDPKQSTLARKLQAGDVYGACQQLPRWNKANVGGVMVPLPGLTKRRAKDMEFCIAGLTGG